MRAMTSDGGESVPSTETSNTANSFTYVLQKRANSCSDICLICGHQTFNRGSSSMQRQQLKIATLHVYSMLKFVEMIVQSHLLIYIWRCFCNNTRLSKIDWNGVVEKGWLVGKGVNSSLIWGKCDGLLLLEGECDSPLEAASQIILLLLICQLLLLSDLHTLLYLQRQYVAVRLSDIISCRHLRTASNGRSTCVEWKDKETQDACSLHGHGKIISCK